MERCRWRAPARGRPLGAPPAAGGAGTPAAGAGSRERTAARAARDLLARLNLPAGAVALAREPSGDGGALAGPAGSPALQLLVDRHGWWRVPRGADQVIAFIRAHRPRGAFLSVTGSESNGRVQSTSLGYQWPTVSSVLGSRMLLIDVVALRDGSTGVRADAQVVWIKARPASERVPAGVGEIDIVRQPSLSLHVTDHAKVSRLVAMINRLPIVQPGAWSCPAMPVHEPVITFTFRSSQGGAVLAVASEHADVREPTTPCDPLNFSIRGQPQTPLLRGAAFLAAAGRLLGVRLGT